MPQHGQAGTKQDEQDTRLFVDGANHKRAVLCADTDRTVITLHDSGGRKLISILAEGKDQPTIDIQRHDEIQRSGDDVNEMN